MENEITRGIAMDTLRLRTLTFKSLMKFGLHKDLTVYEYLYSNKSGYIELASIYYRLSMVSFNDEVLNTLRIDEDIRIEKPGKKPELYHVWKDRYYKRLSNNEWLGARSHGIAKRKRSVRKADKACVKKKHLLQAKNQGHKL